LRIVIIEDHRFFRQGLRDMLGDHGHDVVGEAATAREAPRLAAEHRPDVVIMDLGLPGMSGLDVIAEVSALAPVVVMTASRDEEDLLRALRLGAAGYLLKDAGPEEITAALTAVVAGDAAISPRLAGRLVQEVRAAPPAPPPSAAPALTEREAAVLRLVAAGRDNGQIAAELHVGVSTVKAVVSDLLGRLDADNRVQLAVAAVRHGLV
jgi:DNA-binding NarL/FixJ family response regulator